MGATSARLYVLAVTMTGTMAVACGGSGPSARTQPPRPTPANATASQASTLASGPRVTEVPSDVEQTEPQCRSEGGERCDALDDDCDGRIDEGCGYRSGALQVTAAWSTEADVDLFVTGPDGETVSFKEPRGTSGAHMDHDARGRCRRQQRHRNIENVYWARRPPPGAYHVELRYWSPCGLGEGTRARVSVAVDGELLGTFERTLRREQRSTVLRFELP